MTEIFIAGRVVFVAVIAQETWGLSKKDIKTGKVHTHMYKQIHRDTDTQIRRERG